MKLIKKIILLIGLTSLFFGQNAFADQNGQQNQSDDLRIIKIQLFGANSFYNKKCEKGREFVVIKNLSDHQVDLQNWKLSWETGELIINQSSILGVNQEAIFYNPYFVSDQECQIDQPLATERDFVDSFALKFKIPKIQAGRFNDEQGKIEISDSANNLIDSVSYGQSTGLNLEQGNDSIAAYATNGGLKFDDQGNLLRTGYNRIVDGINYQSLPQYQEPIVCEEGYLYDQTVDQCRLLKPKIIFSEIYNSTAKKNQFIEIYNLNSEEVDISGFKIVDNFNHQFLINETVLNSNQYLAWFAEQLNFSYQPQSVIELKLLSFDGETVIDQVKLSSVSTDRVQAFDGQKWDWSFTQTPNLKNQIVKQLDCKAGYYWNQDSESCLKKVVKKPVPISVSKPQPTGGMGSGSVLAVVAKSNVCAPGYEKGYTGKCVKKCGPGQYRSKTTNRCRNYQIAKVAKAKKTKTQVVSLAKNKATKAKTDCKEGYEIGFTGSCVKKCQPGFVRSKETNRCRKQQSSEQVIDDQILETAFEEIEDRSKFNWWKLINKPLFGGLVGAGGVLIYLRFANKK